MTASVQPARAVKAEPIPLVDLKAQYERYRTELDAAVQRVVANTSFIGGAEVRVHIFSPHKSHALQPLSTIWRLETSVTLTSL